MNMIKTSIMGMMKDSIIYSENLLNRLATNKVFDLRTDHGQTPSERVLQ